MVCKMCTSWYPVLHKNLLLRYFDILRFIWKEKNASSRQVKSQIFWQLCQKYSFPKHITSTFVLYFLFCVICTDLSASPAAVSKISSLKPFLQQHCDIITLSVIIFLQNLWNAEYGKYLHIFYGDNCLTFNIAWTTHWIFSKCLHMALRNVKYMNEV